MVSRPASIPGVAVAFVVGALGFIALGFLLAAVLPSARAAQAVGLTIFFPMWLLAGSGPTRSLFSTALRRVGDLMPLTHVVTSLQDPWFGLGWNRGELALLTALLLGAAALSAGFFRRE